MTLLFRGSNGVPLTSALLSHPGSWEDIKFAIEFVSQKYVRDPVSKEKRTRYYAYGCSMGATMLGAYLINSSDSAEKELDGAVLYGTPWDFHKGENYFYNSAWGFPAYAVAMNLCRVTRATTLPQLK